MAALLLLGQTVGVRPRQLRLLLRPLLDAAVGLADPAASSLAVPLRRPAVILPQIGHVVRLVVPEELLVLPKLVRRRPPAKLVRTVPSRVDTRKLMARLRRLPQARSRRTDTT